MMTEMGPACWVAGNIKGGACIEAVGKRSGKAEQVSGRDSTTYGIRCPSEKLGEFRVQPRMPEGGRARFRTV